MLKLNDEIRLSRQISDKSPIHQGHKEYDEEEEEGRRGLSFPHILRLSDRSRQDELRDQTDFLQSKKSVESTGQKTRGEQSLPIVLLGFFSLGFGGLVSGLLDIDRLVECGAVPLADRTEDLLLAVLEHEAVPTEAGRYLLSVDPQASDSDDVLRLEGSKRVVLCLGHLTARSELTHVDEGTVSELRPVEGIALALIEREADIGGTTFTEQAVEVELTVHAVGLLAFLIVGASFSERRDEVATDSVVEDRADAGISRDVGFDSFHFFVLLVLNNNWAYYSGVPSPAKHWGWG